MRKYPHGEIGAHLFGTVGEITEEQLDDERNNGVELGDRIGQTGIEAEYDRFLRGINGADRVEVDALGNISRPLRDERRPQQGRQLRLSVDLDVQRAGQEALAGGTGKGAFAVMDVDNGRGDRARLLALVRRRPLLQGLHAPAQGRERPARQPRDPGRLSRPARRSSSSRRWPRSRAA